MKAKDLMMPRGIPSLWKCLGRALIQAEEFTKKYPDQAIRIVSKTLEVSEPEIADLWSDKLEENLEDVID